jgi:hypothetical protein
MNVVALSKPVAYELAKFVGQALDENTIVLDKVSYPAVYAAFLVVGLNYDHELEHTTKKKQFSFAMDHLVQAKYWKKEAFSRYRKHMEIGEKELAMCEYVNAINYSLYYEYRARMWL